MTKKNLTIQDLAVMVQKGFLGISSELAEFKTEMREFQRNTIEEFGRINDDIHDIKITLGPLVRIVSNQENEIKNLHLRVGRLERKVGLTK